MKKLFTILSVIGLAINLASSQSLTKVAMWNCATTTNVHILSNACLVYSIQYAVPYTNCQWDFYDSPTNSYLLGHTAYSNITVTVTNTDNITNWAGIRYGDGTFHLLSTNPITGFTNVFTIPGRQLAVITTNVVAAGSTTARKFATIAPSTATEGTAGTTYLLTFDPPVSVVHGIYATNVVPGTPDSHANVAITYSPITR